MLSLRDIRRRLNRHKHPSPAAQKTTRPAKGPTPAPARPKPRNPQRASTAAEPPKPRKPQRASTAAEPPKPRKPQRASTAAEPLKPPKPRKSKTSSTAAGAPSKKKQCFPKLKASNAAAAGARDKWSLVARVKPQRALCAIPIAEPVAPAVAVAVRKFPTFYGSDKNKRKILTTFVPPTSALCAPVRLLVQGPPGSGKSWLAVQVAKFWRETTGLNSVMNNEDFETLVDQKLKMPVDPRRLLVLDNLAGLTPKYVTALKSALQRGAPGKKDGKKKKRKGAKGKAPEVGMSMLLVVGNVYNSRQLTFLRSMPSVKLWPVTFAKDQVAFLKSLTIKNRISATDVRRMMGRCAGDLTQLRVMAENYTGSVSDAPNREVSVWDEFRAMVGPKKRAKQKAHLLEPVSEMCGFMVHKNILDNAANMQGVADVLDRFSLSDALDTVCMLEGNTKSMVAPYLHGMQGVRPRRGGKPESEWPAEYIGMQTKRKQQADFVRRMVRFFSQWSVVDTSQDPPVTIPGFIPSTSELSEMIQDFSAFWSAHRANITPANINRLLRLANEGMDFFKQIEAVLFPCYLKLR